MIQFEELKLSLEELEPDIKDLRKLWDWKR